VVCRDREDLVLRSEGASTDGMVHNDGNDVILGRAPSPGLALSLFSSGTMLDAAMTAMIRHLGGHRGRDLRHLSIQRGCSRLRLMPTTMRRFGGHPGHDLCRYCCQIVIKWCWAS